MKKVSVSSKAANLPIDSQESAATHAQLDALPLIGTPTPPSHAEISIRAYYIYLLKGSQQGHCHDNWHQAERDLTTEGRAAVWSRESSHEKIPASYIPANPMTQHTVGTMSANKIAGN